MAITKFEGTVQKWFIVKTYGDQLSAQIVTQNLAVYDAVDMDNATQFDTLDKAKGVAGFLTQMASFMGMSNVSYAVHRKDLTITKES